MVQGQLFTSETKSQEHRILNYLKSGKRLTALDALTLFQCMRLGARCFNLKKEGHPIKSDKIKTPTGKWVAEYRYEA